MAQFVLMSRPTVMNENLYVSLGCIFLYFHTWWESSQLSGLLHHDNRTSCLKCHCLCFVIPVHTHRFSLMPSSAPCDTLDFRVSPELLKSQVLFSLVGREASASPHYAWPSPCLSAPALRRLSHSIIIFAQWKSHYINCHCGGVQGSGWTSLMNA